MRKFILILGLFTCCLVFAGTPHNQDCLKVAPTNDGRVKYVDKSKGISFILDKGWEVKCECEVPSDHRDCIVMRPKPVKGSESDSEDECEGSAWSISIEVHKGNYDHWLEKEAFKKIGAKYRYVGGRMGDGEEAIAIQGSNWNGILGYGYCGCYDKKTGGYMGLSVLDCEALISNGHRMASIYFPNIQEEHPYLEQKFLKDFRFIEGSLDNQKCLNISQTKDGRVKYVDKPKGISFVLDKGWEVRCSCDVYENLKDCLIARPRDYMATVKSSPCVIDDWLILIRVFPGNYDKWLDEGPFEKEGAKYKSEFSRGGGGSEAIAIRGKGWTGIMGYGSPGCYDPKGGGYIGAGVALLVALISDGHNTAYVEITNVNALEDRQIEKEFLEGFRFTG